MSQIEAMKAALEALEALDGLDTETECVTIHVADEIGALREAIVQAEKAEPFGCVTVVKREGCGDTYQFFRHPDAPYLDNAAECHTVYAALPAGLSHPKPETATGASTGAGCASQPAEPDWSNAGKLIDVAHQAGALGMIAGTSNWAAYVCKHMSASQPAEPVAWRVSVPDEPDLGFWLSVEEYKDNSCKFEPLYTAPPAAQRQPLTDEQREKLRDAFAQALTSVYVCGRVWEAWQFGTMSEGDFQPASPDISRM
ncbi:MAG: hypothetical protein Q8K24_08835 [Hydrogenophaga sp.]|nr:hypothetical protein [Hydrogenophaga sp.]